MRVRRPNEFELLIHNEVIHYFFLSNREHTSTHNRENWLYILEGKGEEPEPPQTPPESEYHPTPTSDISFSSSFVGLPIQQGNNVDYELNTLKGEVTTLCHTLQDQTDIMVEQMDHLFQDIYSLCRAMVPAARHHGI